MRKRKLLPADFADRLESGDRERVLEVFATHLLDARDGRGGQTAIGLYACPPWLAAWLVEQGLDVDAADQFDATPLTEHVSVGNDEMTAALLDLGADIAHRPPLTGRTPLHVAAQFHQPTTASLLIARGADIQAVDETDDSPLTLALRTCANSDIPATTATVVVLLEAGAPITEEARELATEIGRTFEFHRESFDRDSLPDAEAGLARLGDLLGVAAPTPRRRHDGREPIVVGEGPWPEQHQRLWDLLVPSSGAAATAQGEAIRISGRLLDEILRNGGANWDRDYRAMTRALGVLLDEGDGLDEPLRAEAAELVARTRALDVDEDDLERLAALAVLWVRGTPQPIAYPPPTSYRR